MLIVDIKRAEALEWQRRRVVSWTWTWRTEALTPLKPHSLFFHVASGNEIFIYQLFVEAKTNNLEQDIAELSKPIDNIFFITAYAFYLSSVWNHELSI